MRARTALRRWQDSQDLQARNTLARRYSYLGGEGQVYGALEGFSGGLSALAETIRRLPPPTEATGDLLAVARLDQSLTPIRARPSRRPAAVLARPVKRVSSDPALLMKEQSHKPEQDGASDPAPGPSAKSLAVRTAACERLPNVPERVPVQAGARVELRAAGLEYFRKALMAACRAAPLTYRNPEHDQVHLRIGGGQVQIAGRDHHRLHLVTLPAETVGAGSVAVPRDALTPSSWGIAGVLALYERFLLMIPNYCGHDILRAPARLAPFPDVDRDAEALGGVLIDRLELLATVEGITEPVILVRRCGRELQVGGAGVPVMYGHGGRFSVLLDRRYLVDAVRAGDDGEITLEILGAEGPVRLTSGCFFGLIATRSEESLL